METFLFPKTNNKCCPTCLESNLLDEIKAAKCSRCGGIFCLHFASSIDPQYCTECLSNVTLTKEVVTKTYEHYDEENDILTTYRRRARSIRLEGMDWLFAQRKIAQMDDNSLELAIEYHRTLLGGLLKEREDRRIAQAHRYAGLPNPAPSNSQKDRSTVTNTSRTVKKEIKSTTAAANANAVIQGMMASGKLTPAQILAMLTKLKSQTGD